MGDKSKASLSLKAFSILLFVIVIARWWMYVNRYSVNILFWDQWDLYDAFFYKHNLWDIFSWQHGPHRQGIGFIITKILADLSGWNTRLECFAIGAAMFLAMCLAILLKRRLTSGISWVDASIALIFLTPVQSEMFTMVPNLSYSAMPILLLMIYSIAWTISRTMLRYTLVLILNFLLTFTGFGIVVCVITPALFIIEGINAYRQKNDLALPLAGILFSMLAIAVFSVGYRFDPAVPNFAFPAERFWVRYPRFMSLLFAAFFQVGENSVIPAAWLGFSIMATMAWICIFHLRRLFNAPLRPEEIPHNLCISRSIFLLSSFTLIFSVLAAIGRVSLEPYVSRYLSYIIPGIFAAYLHMIYIASRVKRDERKNLIYAITIFILVAGSFPLNKKDCDNLENFAIKKSAWRYFYIISGNVEKTDKAIDFKIHPFAKRIHLKEKLDYLKARKLNLYLPD